MSSLLIHGMDLPDGGYITVDIALDADGLPMAVTKDGDVYWVTQVPAHGRLVDADVLKEQWTHRDLDLFAQGWGYLQDLNRAPTIMPKED